MGKDQASGGARARSRKAKRNSGGVRSRRDSMIPDDSNFESSEVEAHHQSIAEEQQGQKKSPAEASAQWRGSADNTAASSAAARSECG